jgi:hypothetical protein
LKPRLDTFLAIVPVAQTIADWQSDAGARWALYPCSEYRRAAALFAARPDIMDITAGVPDAR